MSVTDIKVYGFARDSRTPNRAHVRLQVSKWGRDWETTHQAVMSGVGKVLDVIRSLMASKPQALQEPSITQISQKTWADDIGVAYSETVDVTVIFTDFHVMSQWIFKQPHGLFHVQRIEWRLSDDIEDEVNMTLSVQAVCNARLKAETFAAAAGLIITGIVALSDPQLATNQDITTSELPPSKSPSRQAE